MGNETFYGDGFIQIWSIYVICLLVGDKSLLASFVSAGGTASNSHILSADGPNIP